MNEIMSQAKVLSSELSLFIAISPSLILLRRSSVGLNASNKRLSPLSKSSSALSVLYLRKMSEFWLARMVKMTTVSC